jgi:hypothetical protein
MPITVLPAANAARAKARPKPELAPVIKKMRWAAWLMFGTSRWIVFELPFQQLL